MYRRNLNIALILLSLVLGGVAVWVAGLPPHDVSKSEEWRAESGEIVEEEKGNHGQDFAEWKASPSDSANNSPEIERNGVPSEARDYSVASLPTPPSSLRYEDQDPHTMLANHPFRKEAQKIISSRLEESDSISRRKILSYCEHFRTSYTTKDIDFLRQVFSDNALIIVGNVVKTGKKLDAPGDAKVSYAIRSKQAFLAKLEEIFKANKTIKVDFSEFKIMRHPTMNGIYGVSLQQKYATDNYADDGYLFLLWDFRNSSMPQIHVRTWQPHRIIAEGAELIDFSDFNLE